MYLGPSGAHARSVGLILSLTTGLVSPQFHVRYDNSFESVKRLKLSDSKWQQKCHFVPVPTEHIVLPPPANSLNEGASSTNEGATRAAIAPVADQRTAPLPYPLPLEPMGYQGEPGAEPELPPLPELVGEVLGEQAPEPQPVLQQEPATTNTDATVRRSNRARRPSRRM